MRSRSSPLLAFGVSVSCLVSLNHAAATAQTPDTTATPRTLFSVDVVVERSIVQADGQVVHQLPPVRYRLTRSQTSTGRTSTVTLERSRAFPATGPLADPFAGFRVEYDERGGSPRVYNAKGERLPEPDLEKEGRVRASVPLIESGSFGDLIAKRAGATERRQHLQRDLGPPVGRVRGLDRFLSAQGEVTHEVLVDPADAVPVEVNLARNGALESHVTFDYQVLSDGSLLRRAARSESLVPGRPDHRLLTRTTYGNVQLAEQR